MEYTTIHNLRNTDMKLHKIASKTYNRICAQVIKPERRIVSAIGSGRDENGDKFDAVEFG